MATRKPSPRKTADPAKSDTTQDPVAESLQTASEEPAIQAAAELAEQPGAPEMAEAPAGPSAETNLEDKEVKEHQPRFHFFIIDAGWKSNSAKVIRDNFHMIREFQNDDPLYVLTREQSIELIRDNPDLIGRDPIILVHDLHAKGGRGEKGYHGFRLCLGLIKNSQKALEAMQEFLRFVHHHRRSADIEKDIRKRLHHAGFEGALEVIREGAGELME